jgi:hypothetical protein
LDSSQNNRQEFRALREPYSHADHARLHIILKILMRIDRIIHRRENHLIRKHRRTIHAIPPRKHIYTEHRAADEDVAPECDPEHELRIACHPLREGVEYPQRQDDPRMLHAVTLERNQNPYRRSRRYEREEVSREGGDSAARDMAEAASRDSRL